MPSNANDLRILVVADDLLARADCRQRSIYIDLIRRASRHHNDSQIKIKAVLVPLHTH